MGDMQTKRVQKRRRKALRVRARLRGNAARPRLTVFRSLTNIYCQVIDDRAGRTLAAASSLDPAVRETLAGLKKVQIAAKVGSLIAERAKASGVTRVCLDRGHYQYHGRIKALADAARKGGLEF